MESDEFVGLKIRKTLYDKFIDIVEKEGYTKSSFIREALRNELKNRGVNFEKKTDLAGDMNKEKK